MNRIDYLVIEQLQKEARTARSREVYRLIQEFFAWVRSAIQTEGPARKPAPCC